MSTLVMVMLVSCYLSSNLLLRLTSLDMPQAKTPLSELGVLAKFNGEYCAHVQYRDGEGKQIHIYGPRRSDKKRAQGDLQRLRGAGGIGKTREQGFEYMKAEAQRIHIEARYQADIDAAAQRLKAKEQEAQEQEEEVVAPSDQEPSEEEPWLKDYPEPTPVEPPSDSQPLQLTPIEATAALQKFRPIKSHPKELQQILACRADPNYPLGKGNISPLWKVMTFATEAHVAEMRRLLLEYGAHEGDDEMARWELRQRSDRCERIRLQDQRDIESIPLYPY